MLANFSQLGAIGQEPSLQFVSIVLIPWVESGTEIAKPVVKQMPAHAATAKKELQRVADGAEYAGGFQTSIAPQQAKIKAPKQEVEIQRHQQKGYHTPEPAASSSTVEIETDGLVFRLFRRMPTPHQRHIGLGALQYLRVAQDVVTKDRRVVLIRANDSEFC